MPLLQHASIIRDLRPYKRFLEYPNVTTRSDYVLGEIASSLAKTHTTTSMSRVILLGMRVY